MLLWAAARSHRRSTITQVLIAAAAALAAMHLEVALTAGHLHADMEILTSRAYGIASGVVSLPVLGWAARGFYRQAWQGIRLRRWNLDATVGATIAIAVIGSIVNLFVGAAAVYFGAITMFVALLLLGRWLLAEARLRAAGSLAMHGLLPVDAVQRHEDGSTVLVAAANLQPGQQVELKPGSQVPADCVLEHGEVVIEAAVLTGEARPVTVGCVDELPAGAGVLAGDGYATVLRPASASALGNLLSRLADNANRGARVQAWSDRIQVWYAPLVLVLAVAAAWTWRADPIMAWQVAIGLILACCPCAFGLATPLALARFQDRLAAQGVLVRDGSVVESLAVIDCVAVDKTGTLTTGVMSVSEWWWHPAVPADHHKAIALGVANAEAGSRHPLAPAIIAATNDFIDDSNTSSKRIFQSDGDNDAAKQVDGGVVLTDYEVNQQRGELVVGSWQLVRHYLTESPLDGDIVTPGPVAARVYVVFAGRLLAALVVDDPVRPVAARWLQDLSSVLPRNSITLLSGDRRDRAESLAQSMGIADVSAELLPEQKMAWIEQRQAAGHRVLMLGDGLNDTAALATADVGIGVRGALEAVLESGSVAIARDDPAAIQHLFAGSRQTRRVIAEAWVWATAYNALAVASVWAGIWGPLVCAIAMPLSSILVIAWVLYRLR